ncbi:methylmalonyl-CoA epimerase [Chloroflexota bacterium]
MIKRLHHVAIAVSNLDESVALYERILGVKPSAIEEVPSQKVRAALFQVGEAEIELIQPTEPDSGVAKFIESRGQGIHHVCLEVDEVNEELKDMAAKGITLIDKEGRVGLVGKVGFLHPKSTQGVLIELAQCET